MLVATLANCGHGATTSGLDVLERSLGDAFEVLSEGSHTELRYCPDNTCLVFESDDASEKETADFMALYLYFVPSYSYLLEPPDGGEAFVKRARPYVMDVLERLGKDCEGDGVNVAICALTNAKNHYGVSLSSARFDENAFVKSEIGWQSKMNHDALAERQAEIQRMLE